VSHRPPVQLAVLFALLAPASAAATDFPATCGNLQAQLSLAGPGDTVTLDDQGTACPLTYTMGPGDTLQGATPAVTLTNTSGRSIIGSNVGNATLRNLTITGGNTAGGVWFSDASTPTIDNVDFFDNATGGNGGGLLISSTASSGTVTITGSNFGSSGPNRPNVANQGGGAHLGTSGAAIAISSSDFTNNFANVRGGGLFVQGNGPVTIADSILGSNTAGGTQSFIAGGGASIDAPTLTITDSAFFSNSLTPSNTGTFAYGGGLHVSYSGLGRGTATLTHVQVLSNTIQSRTGGTPDLTALGGGAYISAEATLSRDSWGLNSIRAHGASDGRGAGLYLSAPDCGAATETMSSEAFASNRFQGTSSGNSLGAGFYLDRCTDPITLNATNITVAANQVLSCSATCSSGIASAFSDDVLNISNSVVYGNTGAGEISGGFPAFTFSDACMPGVTYTAGNGNICADPLLSGGTTEAANSPTIDKGSNALVPDGLLAWGGGTRILDGDGSCTATVDMGADERTGLVVDCSPPIVTPPADTPPADTPPADNTPPVVTPPITDPGQVLLCEGRKVVLIDTHREGRSQVVAGLSLSSLAGKKVRITADHGGGTVTATIRKDGSFSVKVPAPKGDQISYTAHYGKDKSIPLKVSRNLTVVSQKKVAGGLRIVARHSKRGRVRGEKAVVLKQTGCNRQRTYKTLKFDGKGEVTIVLPLPKPPDRIAVYRVTTRVNKTFTLPIVVRR
jgi:hypothetical protein